MTERAALIHYARVMIRESRARRHERRFRAFLLNCAMKATHHALRAEAQLSLNL